MIPQHVVDDGTRDTLHVDAVVLVEVLILRGQKSVDDHFRHDLDGHVDAAFFREFRDEPAVARVHAGNDGRLIVRQLLVIGQILRDLPEEIGRAAWPRRETQKRPREREAQKT